MNENSFLFAYTATTTLMWLSHQNKLAFSRNDPRSMHDFTHCFRILLVNVRVYTHHASLLRLPFSLFSLFLSLLSLFSLLLFTIEIRKCDLAAPFCHSHKWYRKYFFSCVYPHIFFDIVLFKRIETNLN